MYFLPIMTTHVTILAQYVWKAQHHLLNIAFNVSGVNTWSCYVQCSSADLNFELVCLMFQVWTSGVGMQLVGRRISVFERLHRQCVYPILYFYTTYISVIWQASSLRFASEPCNTLIETWKSSSLSYEFQINSRTYSLFVNTEIILLSVAEIPQRQ